MAHDEQAVGVFRAHKIEMPENTDVTDYTASIFISGGKAILATGSGFETINSAE